MDELIDRLAFVAPRPSRDLDVEHVRRGARRRQRRRTTGLGVAGALCIIAGGLGAVRLLADDPTSTHRVTTAAPLDSVPAAWGGPVDIDAGDDELYVTLEERVVIDGPGPGRAGLARLDPATGELSPVAEIRRNADVAYGAGSLWVAQPDGRWLDQLDPDTGERLARVDVGSVAPATVEPAWRIAAGGRYVWLVGDYEGNAVIRVDVESLTPSLVGQVGQVLTPPLVVGDEVWFGQADGLRRVTAAGRLEHFTGTVTGERVTALAWDGTRIWMASSEIAGASSVLSYVEPDVGLADRAWLQLPLPGGVEAIGVVDGDLCADVNGVNSTPAIRCGNVVRTTGTIELDRILSNDGTGIIDGPALVPFGDHLWGTWWTDGVVLRIDPTTATSEVVVDLPFDGGARIDARFEATGPEVEVASGPMPGGEGSWTFYAYESASGLCTRVDSPGGGGGECAGPPDEQVFSLGYSDGRGTQAPTDAHAIVAPEVALVRFELASGTVIDVEPVDVGFDRNFVYTLVPDDDIVERALALGDDGQVLDIGAGFSGIPDD